MPTAAKTAPKTTPAEPGSIKSIRRQVDDLKTATALLKVVQTVEKAAAEPKRAQSDAHFRHAFFDLESLFETWTTWHP